MEFAQLDEVFEGFPTACGAGEEQIMLPSSDGVRLRTEIFRPDGIPAPWPVVVTRTCYPFSWPQTAALGREYAKRGFAFVCQFCRGTGGSEGTWEPNVNERRDGLALTEWLDRQPWAGSIGYKGHSYPALCGWTIADAVPDKVKTMFLTGYGVMRHASAWQDGLFRQDVLTAWAMDNAGRPVTADYLTSAAYRPQVEVDTALWGVKLPWYRDWITHPALEDPYWTAGFWGELAGIPAKVKIPIYLGEGWYDHHLGSALLTWQALSEETKRRSVLEIGPVDHNGTPVLFGHPGAVNAGYNMERRAIEWFAETLARDSRPRPGARLYAIGADEWRFYPSYPIETDGTRILYLFGSRLADTPGENGFREYVYDPENPVPTLGAESALRSIQKVQGCRLQPEPDYRPDVLSFTSDVMPESVNIAGKISLELYVRSDAPDTCFAVKLSEVMPDGKAYHIRNAVTTLKRNGGAGAKTVNGARRINLRAWDILWRTTPGSRLRLDITSSDFPEYSVHPNTSELWSRVRESRRALQTVLFGRAYPSRVILPLEN